MWNERDRGAVECACLLGVASIGIGVLELLFPRKVESMLGMAEQQSHRGILRVLGLRELMHGVGILSSLPHANGELATAVWSRVAGDMLDNALLAVAATKTKRPASFAATTLGVMAIGAADWYCAKQLS